MAKKAPAKQAATDYEELGKMMESVYETAYVSRWRMMRMSFLKGIAAGFGGVIGATIVVGLLAWVLSLFDELPLLGPLTEKIQDSVQTKSQQ